jgi:hypothetical protein
VGNFVCNFALFNSATTNGYVTNCNGRKTGHKHKGIIKGEKGKK